WGRISRIRIIASALGPALNRQAGFTAARPAAKRRLERQAVLAVVLNDRPLLARALDGELRCPARTLRLRHDLLAKFVKAGGAGRRQSTFDIGSFDLASGTRGSRFGSGCFKPERVGVE